MICNLDQLIRALDAMPNYAWDDWTNDEIAQWIFDWVENDNDR